MVDDEIIQEAIAHYVSGYYDPKKAHEDYLRRRKLKGRNFTTKGFSSNQKEAWSYIKKQVQQKKDKQTEQSRVARDAAIVQARRHADALRADISRKLLKLSDHLAGIDSKSERKKIANELKAVIAKYRAKYAADKNTAASSAKRALNTEYKNVKKIR